MTFFKTLTRLLIGFLLITCALSLLYRLVNPVSTVMLKRWAFGQHVEYSYVPIERMSPHLIKAIIVAEDGRFCAHHGVDWQEMKKALIDAAEDSTPRGASTLSMQVTRNLFLWQGRSYIRKILEVPLSMFVDPIIGKPRLLEIYLNVAEWGRGIFGAEAASQHYFHKSPTPPAATQQSQAFTPSSTQIKLRNVYRKIQPSRIVCGKLIHFPGHCHIHQPRNEPASGMIFRC